MKKQPKEMYVCKLEFLLMPNGEMICKGYTIGWFDTFKEHITKGAKI